jgi:uncharacterized 2Fe-2S/4Fe-4S cluster protein (DUF4445 family)
MPVHRVTFSPSGRSTLVADGAAVLEAAEQAREPLRAECGGRGACGRCLVRILEGQAPEYRILRREAGVPVVLACLTAVHGPLTVAALAEVELPKLVSRQQNTGLAPIDAWAPWPLKLEPIVASSGDAGKAFERGRRGRPATPAGASHAGRPRRPRSRGDLGVAVDIGTTTLRLLLIRLSDGVVLGEAGAYNPQIPRGADVISRIMAAGKGLLEEMACSVRKSIASMIREAAEMAAADPAGIRGYVVAGNVTMIHLLLAADPSGIRRVPSQPQALAFAPVKAASLGWPGWQDAPVYTVPAAGGWVGGDIVAGAVRAGFSRATEAIALYVDLGTNGEIVLGGADFALACACSAGPAFEGGGIRCGMRADRGAVDGACVDEGKEALKLSVISGQGAAGLSPATHPVRPRGLCGSGLIAVAHALFHAGWIDRGGRFTDRLPAQQRVEGTWGVGVRLSQDGKVALWERDLASLIRAKAAVFAGIRSLLRSLGPGFPRIQEVVVSGNFGRFLNLPAALGIGLLPSMPLRAYRYVDNGALEGAALALLSKEFFAEISAYLRRITYVDLADLPGYMDEFVGASFLPHTHPEMLQL